MLVANHNRAESRFVPMASVGTSRANDRPIDYLIERKLDGLPDWNAVLQKEVLAGDKLDMPNSSYTAAAIEAAPDHAVGHVWTPEAASPVDFSPIFPYGFGAAGDINTTARSLVKWLRL